ncbi:unnamed protein product, partial [Closterium sp. NIES-54]
VLQRFGFQFSSPQPTPLSTSHSLSAPPSDESVEPSGPYPELVGCLMYLMTCTRPDLAYPLSLLARYVAPGRYQKVNRDAAKRVLRYLCSTSGMGLALGGRGPVVLPGHADASWVDDSATQRSSQGYTFSLGSGYVSWRSTRSSLVLSSSCEAEIYAGAMAAQELRWLTYLLSNLGEQPRSPPVLRAARQPSCPAAEPPSSRAAQQPSRLAAESPSRPAVESLLLSGEIPPYWPLQSWLPPVLTFDGEGRAVDFEVWVDDLQLFLQCDRADGLSLFDLTSGASPAPPATADSTVRSQWATRDAAARLAVRRHLPTTERAHFSQYKSAHTLYNAVVASYSSPANAALSRLILPYLFPDLAAFPTVADLITHLRTSDTRYRAALPAEDHFISVCPTTLTIDLLKQRLLAAETSIIAVGASRGDPRTPVFEGCSPYPLLPFVASAAAADLGGFESVGAASAPSERRRPAGARGAGALVGLEGAVEEVVVAMEGVGVVVGVVAGVEVSAAAVEAEEAVAVAEGAEVAVVAEAAEAAVELVAALSRGAAPVAVSISNSSTVMRPRPPSSFVSDRAGEQCGGLHSTQRCFGRLTDTWRHQFPDATEIPRWHDLLKSGRDYELHSLDFSTAFLQGNLHEEIWLRRPPCFTGSFPPGTQWSLRRPVYGLPQAPREWHDTLRTTLAALGFAPSTADPSLFLRTDTSLPPFYILVYVEDLVFATADTTGLAHVKSELQKRHTCTDLGELRSYLGLQITRDRAQRTITLTRSHMVQQCTRSGHHSRHRFWFRSCMCSYILPPFLHSHASLSLPSRHLPRLGSRRSHQESHSTAEIYAGAMAAQELRWLTYLLADLGEPPRSPPVLYVDNKAMLALCREHRLEHRTKHIALRYFLARELQQRGQLRLAYVDSQANTADIFTKALPPGDHQHFCTMLDCVVFLLVVASRQVFAAASGSGRESAPCSCRLLSHQTLLWHHRLGHPSLPRLRGMASRVLVSGLPRSLPPLPLGPAPTCVPCVEGRQRAAPHSSEFPPTEAPLQTLHMDVWGPARVRGQGHERYFLLVVDDYLRYTTVFPLCIKGDVTERRRVFLCPSGSLLSCTGHPPDLHASGLSTAKWDC